MKRLEILLVVVVLLSVFGASPAAAQTSVPAAATADPAVTTTAVTTIVYTVLPGDTLARLAARFHTTIAALLRANPGIRNPNLIRIGQRLVIPVGGGVPLTAVKVALIALNGNGGVGCGDSVVMITRQVPYTTAPLTAALRELLAINTQYYGQSGLYDALYQSRLAIQSVTIANQKATIRLTGQIQVGGECDDPRVIAQFERTATQFATVKTVAVYVNGVLLQTLLSGK